MAPRGAEKNPRGGRARKKAADRSLRVKMMRLAKQCPESWSALPTVQACSLCVMRCVVGRELRLTLQTLSPHPWGALLLRAVFVSITATVEAAACTSQGPLATGRCRPAAISMLTVSARSSCARSCAHSCPLLRPLHAQRCGRLTAARPPPPPPLPRGPPRRLQGKGAKQARKGAAATPAAAPVSAAPAAAPRRPPPRPPHV